ncbi:molybdate ABC transporter substrate-binding protein [Salipiger sp. PrR002]|uniref:molybdate ABC transporter substrate-binding protein n=1 Tax=Salipiger sp. PrR002 TaxID=2706489 RepID=UPI0013B9126F|nr:molybdate ABC transporter substrate-binding protein [Salipiger sp. PrR002]NDV98347.1 molybdate ABC transporter substrate-binding protein [Salipiger sp. PrR002]NDW55059.1 molybdate ABC transporter substrate-binding protein [Salipiger sp. PrR004]
MPFSRFFARLAGSALLASLPFAAQADEVTVFAAASLKNAMDEIKAAYEAGSDDKITVSLAGSSALARQIQQGAPADIFISANEPWMDTLEAEGLLEPGTRSDLLRNSIVLIAHGNDAAPVEIDPGLDLQALLEGGRLAMALVDAVPAGIYGKAALESLGLWQQTAPDVAQADNVRAALALVSTGEAPLGIVYATDAAADDNVSVIGTFPEDSHPPIIYPVADIATRDTPAESAFLDYLHGPEARAAFERQGFVVAGPAKTGG